MEKEDYRGVGPDLVAVPEVELGHVGEEEHPEAPGQSQEVHGPHGLVAEIAE